MTKSRSVILKTQRVTVLDIQGFLPTAWVAKLKHTHMGSINDSWRQFNIGHWVNLGTADLQYNSNIGMSTDIFETLTNTNTDMSPEMLLSGPHLCSSMQSINTTDNNVLCSEWILNGWDSSNCLFSWLFMFVCSWGALLFIEPRWKEMHMFVLMCGSSTLCVHRLSTWSRLEPGLPGWHRDHLVRAHRAPFWGAEEGEAGND